MGLQFFDTLKLAIKSTIILTGRSRFFNSCIKKRYYPAYQIIKNILQLVPCTDCGIITPYYPEFSYLNLSGWDMIQCKKRACICVINDDLTDFCKICNNCCCSECTRGCECFYN